MAKVSVGITTIIGYLTMVLGIIPLVVKLLESTQGAMVVGGPEKWGAIISAVALFITSLGRYLQAHAIIKSTLKS